MATFHKVKEQNFIEFCSTCTPQDVLEAVKGGFNVNAENEFGSTALHFAARYNKDPEVIKTLLRCGADVNFQAYDGNSALMWASTSGTEEIIKILLEAGAEVNAARPDGLTALHGAARKNTPEVMKHLLTAGASVSARDSNGMTPLLVAAMNNPDPKVVELLIDAGSDDTTNKNGETALILAARWNKPEVVEELIKAGANPLIKDLSGKNAHDYALENEKLKGSGIPEKLEKLIVETVKERADV